MSTKDATAWGGSGSYALSLQPLIYLEVDECDEGFAWCITEAWKLGEYPEEVKKRKRLYVHGRSATVDAAKEAAEQMAARILKRRRSYR